MLANLVGKKVKVVMRDGFLKRGILKSLDANFIVLDYGNYTEAINLNFIKSVREENENNNR